MIENGICRADRDRKKIDAMKKLLSDSPRDHLLFTIGINTAFRVSDLLTLKYSDVMDDKGNYLNTSP